MKMLLTKRILGEEKGGRRKGVCVTILVILTTATLLSCDSFFLNPSARINPMDPNIPLTGFRAFPISEEEVQLMWDWFDLERDVRGEDPVYDKIAVSHSKNNYPDSRFGGEEFSISDFNPASDSLQKTVFPDLERDREHYFALYGHEKDGGWTAPVYASAHTEEIYSYSLSDLIPFTTMNIEMSVPQVEEPLTGWTVTDTNWHLYYFGDSMGSEVETVIDGTMTIEIEDGAAVGNTLIIYPMREIFEGSQDPTLLNAGDIYVDRSVRKEYEIPEIGALTFDLTDVLTRAVYHSTYGIIFTAEGSETIPIKIDASPTTTIEVIERWY